MSKNKSPYRALLQMIDTTNLGVYSQIVDATKEGEAMPVETIEEARSSVSFACVDGFEIRKESWEDYINEILKDGNVSDNGTVAIIPVKGVMSQSDGRFWGMRYAIGTDNIARIIQQLDQEQNIGTIVFDIDTPGGTAQGNEQVFKAISKCKTPTMASYSSMTSAGVYAFQACDKIYAKESISTWGSIGVISSFVDDRKYWDEMGIKIVDVYATSSSGKNRAYRDALEGDYSGLEARAEMIAQDFISKVKKARPDIVDDGKVFTGTTYNASEAKKINAIDGIKTFQQVLTIASKDARSYNRGRKKSNDNMSDQNANKELEQKVEAMQTQLAEMKSVLPVVTKAAANEKVAEANQMLEESNQKLEQANATLKIVTQSNADKDNEIATLKEQLETANASLKQAQDQLAEKAEKDEQANEEAKERKVSFESMQEQFESMKQQMKQFADENEALKQDNDNIVAMNKKLGGDAIKHTATPQEAAQDDPSSSPSGGKSTTPTFSAVNGKKEE